MMQRRWTDKWIDGWMAGPRMELSHLERVKFVNLRMEDGRLTDGRQMDGWTDDRQMDRQCTFNGWTDR